MYTTLMEISNKAHDQLSHKVEVTHYFGIVFFSTFHSENVKVKVTLEQATKAQRGSRCIALLFLQPWH